MYIVFILKHNNNNIDWKFSHKNTSTSAQRFSISDYVWPSFLYSKYSKWKLQKNYFWLFCYVIHSKTKFIVFVCLFKCTSNFLNPKCIQWYIVMSIKTHWNIMESYFCTHNYLYTTNVLMILKIFKLFSLIHFNRFSKIMYTLSLFLKFNVHTIIKL